MDLPQTNKNAIRCKAYRARRRAEGLPYDKTWIDRAKRSKAKNVTTNAEYCRAYRQRKRQLGNDVTNNCLIRNMEGENDECIDISGYRRIAQYKRRGVRAGGVAIYERKGAKVKSKMHKMRVPTEDQKSGIISYEYDGTATRIPRDMFTLPEKDLKFDRCMKIATDCGDVCAVEASMSGHSFLVVSLYISPGTSIGNLRNFIFTNFVMYTPRMAAVYKDFDDEYYSNMSKYASMPIILGGDFNLDLRKPENIGFVDFMHKWLNMSIKTDSTLATTRHGTCIDHVFTRHIESLPCFNYVSYFSYHRPILSRYTPE